MSFPEFQELKTKNAVRTNRYIDQLMTDKYIPELAATITKERVNIGNGKSFYVFFDEKDVDINEKLCNKMGDFLRTQGYNFKATYNASFRGSDYCSFK